MKILLIDTGFSALPIYKFLRHYSDDVWVMGNRADDVIAKHAGNRWIRQDYSDVYEVQRIVKKHKFKFIVPGCTDVSMDTCVKIDPDVSYRDTARVNEVLNTKSLFRAVCKEFKLPCPQVVNPKHFPAKGKFICKPVDGYSGRGVSIFDGESKQQLDEACEIARISSPTGNYIIEDYIEGELYSCTGFVQNRKLTDYFFVKEGSSANPYAVDTSYVVETMPSEVVLTLIDALNKLSRNLELKDGLLHTQFILSSQGPMLIEMTRRCPGDLYSLLIEYTTGYEYAAKYASYHLGIKFKTSQKFHKPIVRHTVSSDDDCIFDGLEMTSEIKTHAFFSLLNLGSELRPNQKDRVGLLFCEPLNKHDINKVYQTFLNRESYKLSMVE